MKGKRRNINDDIRAYKVQLISDDWENFWDMTLDEAKQKASQEWLDLMEMWKNGDVTIVKILDYGKFLYRQKKQDKKNKQKWKAPELKTLRITFKIWDHDLDIKRKQATKFAEGWHALKISLMLRWRENHYSDLAIEKMESFIKSLEEIYKLENRVTRSRNIFTAMLKPKK